MIKQITTLVALTVAMTANPAPAADGTSGKGSVASSPSSASHTRMVQARVEEDRVGQQGEPKGVVSKLTTGPKTALGVTCGVMVGVPVRIARDTKKYTLMMRKSMMDGLAYEGPSDYFAAIMATACAVPFGVGTGIIHGSIRGTERAFVVGGEKPFSKESMSLGETD